MIYLTCERLLIESWVWFHGFSVAIMIRKGVWWQEMSPYMFGYGFGTIFFYTQIYSLPLWYDKGVRHVFEIRLVHMI